MAKKSLILFFLLISLLPLSCGQKEATQASKPDTYKDPYPMPVGAMTVPVTGKHGGRIVGAEIADPKTFNPLLGDD